MSLPPFLKAPGLPASCSSGRSLLSARTKPRNRLLFPWIFPGTISAAIWPRLHYSLNMKRLCNSAPLFSLALF
jgi:hypothetical protein